MKNIKKILSVLLTLALFFTMMFSLISCNDDKGNGDGENNGNNTGDGKFNYTVTVTDTDGNAVSGVKLMITDDIIFPTAKDTDANGKSTITLDAENKKLGVLITGVPEGYEKPAEDADGFHAKFGDKNEVTVKLSKKVTETTEYTVKVVDQNGNAVEGVKLQICHTVCVTCPLTNASGESKQSLPKSVSEITLKVGLLEVPEGYTMPVATIDDSYHTTIAPGETTVTITIEKNA